MFSANWVPSACIAAALTPKWERSRENRRRLARLWHWYRIKAPHALQPLLKPPLTKYVSDSGGIVDSSCWKRLSSYFEEPTFWASLAVGHLLVTCTQLVNSRGNAVHFHNVVVLEPGPSGPKIGRTYVRECFLSQIFGVTRHPKFLYNYQKIRSFEVTALSSNFEEQ